MQLYTLNTKLQSYKLTKLRGRSPQANYTDRATAACRRISANHCGYRVLRGQRNHLPRPLSRFSRSEPLVFHSSSSSTVLTRLSGPRSRPPTS
jgi:hypothetical protein